MFDQKGKLKWFLTFFHLHWKDQTKVKANVAKEQSFQMSQFFKLLDFNIMYVFNHFLSDFDSGEIKVIMCKIGLL